MLFRSVHRKRLVAQLARFDIFKKVPARNQHVGGNGEFAAAAHLDERGIVADTEQRMPCGMSEVAPDQFEFGRGHARGARLISLNGIVRRSLSALLRGLPPLLERIRQIEIERRENEEDDGERACGVGREKVTALEQHVQTEQRVDDAADIEQQDLAL